MSGQVLIQGLYGGRVEQTGARQLRATYPHRFITALLMFPVALFSLGAVAMTVGAVLDGLPQMLPGAVLGGAFAAALFFVARTRMRTMGDFELDVDAGTLRRLSGERELDAWPLASVVMVRKRWDVFHRGFQRAYWLTVEVADGRVLRLGKGGAEELGQTLALLESWGLRVDRE
jgi:hypothetical protein